MDGINEIAQQHNLAVIEDAAQAAGARYNNALAGSLGTVGCFSLHPLKTLHACGDGGIITTDDAEIYEYLIKARNHGLRNRDEAEFWSQNSRLDSLHAAMLSLKIQHLDEETEERRRIAAFYQERLSGLVKVPTDQGAERSVYQTFVIHADRRDELQRYLVDRGVDAKVHYPVPIHLQPAAAELGHVMGDFPVTERLSREILSLPAHPRLSMKQLEHTTNSIRQFYSK
jgi:dTDP-4-amino-4,6-dideoxygalactose transaminase